MFLNCQNELIQRLDTFAKGLKFLRSQINFILNIEISTAFK